MLIKKRQDRWRNWFLNMQFILFLLFRPVWTPIIFSSKAQCLSELCWWYLMWCSLLCVSSSSNRLGRRGIYQVIDSFGVFPRNVPKCVLGVFFFFRLMSCAVFFAFSLDIARTSFSIFWYRVCLDFGGEDLTRLLKGPCESLYPSGHRSIYLQRAPLYAAAAAPQTK